MKHTIKFLTAALLLAVLWSTPPVATAQTPKTDEPNDLKAEQQAVQKFADSFMQSLNETKDIDKIPEKFFVADFKTRFIQNEFESNEEFFVQLSESERYEYNVSMFNFYYLSMMSVIGNSEVKDYSDDNEDEDYDSTFEKMFAPEAFKIIKTSKVLQPLLGNSDAKIKNLVELQSFITDLKRVNEAQRRYLNERPLKWKENFAQNLARAKENELGTHKNYNAMFCEGEDCEDLPEKTRIFDVVALPLFLKIVKENGELRILSLQPISD